MRISLLILPALVSGAMAASDFGMSANPDADGVHLQYEAQTGHYYRIHSAASVAGPWSVLEFQLGRTNLQSWLDAGAMVTNEFRYYRVGRVPMHESLDYDGDGLVDAYEMTNAFLDLRAPDSDRDRISDGDEFHVFGTVPWSPYSAATLHYTFETNGQGWVGDDGAVVSWNAVGHPAGGGLAIQPPAGAGSVTCVVRDGSLVDNVDASLQPMVRAWVYVPQDAPANAVTFRLRVRSSADGWQVHAADSEFAPAPGSWQVATFDLSGLGAAVLADLDEWGVQITWADRDQWSGTVLVDTIHNATPTPADVPPGIAAVTAPSGPAGTYQKFELTVVLTHVAGLNPYDPTDIGLEADFTSPSGRVWTIWGFYMENEDDAAGRGEWKIRFAPNETGLWTYRVRAGNRHGTNVFAVSNFTCVASGEHGWVRVSDDDAHYLEHADDTPFYGIGYCRPYDVGDDEGLFEDAEQHGVNMLHWWLAPWDTLLTVKAAEPGRESSTFYSYEQARARKVDRAIEMAERHGVKFVFTIWTHDALRDFNYHKFRCNGSWQPAFDEKSYEPEWYCNAFSDLDEPSQNQKFFHDPRYIRHQEQLYRYIIARWGHSEAVGFWGLVSELFGTIADSRNAVNYQDPRWVNNKSDLVGRDPYDNMPPDQVDGRDHSIEWITFIHDFFKNNDPYRHPTTACNATDEYWDEGFEIIDIPQIHSYADTFSWITPPVTLAKYHHAMAAKFNKPAFIGETGSWKWRTYQPDFLRACMWPALCSGAAVTPMMWTVPAFGKFCDPVMGPWLAPMADEAYLFSKFVKDIPFHRLHMAPAPVWATDPGEPASKVIDSFEGGVGADWHMFGSSIAAVSASTQHVTHGSLSLRMDLDMDTWSNETNPASGVYNFSLADDWSSYWPDGTLRLDLTLPDFYHPTNNPDGYLLGINRDPRVIIEVATESEDGSWRYYSTRRAYAAEHEGWKKLTVGMLYNLEFNLEEIPTEYQAERIRGIKIWMGDAGMQRGPVYVDNITVGRYPYNTWGMVSSNGDLAIGWVQDRQWTNTLNRRAIFTVSALRSNSIYNVESWNSKNEGINSTFNTNCVSGTLGVKLPDFRRDVALKIRRVGAMNATVHDVAVGTVSQVEWFVRSSSSRVLVTAVNRGTERESFDLTLFDETDGRGMGTNRINNLGAGRATTSSFTWNTTAASLGWHTLRARAVPVDGEANTADNELEARIRVVNAVPPWDSCDRHRRWATVPENSDCYRMTVSTNRATEGAESFLLEYTDPTYLQACIGYDNVFENWSNRTEIALDVYNEGTADGVQFQMRTGTNWVWYYSAWQGLSAGWNTNLTFSFSSATWEREEGTNYAAGVRAGGLEDMQRIYIKISGYTNAGSAYVDNIRLRP